MKNDRVSPHPGQSGLGTHARTSTENGLAERAFDWLSVVLEDDPEGCLGCGPGWTFEVRVPEARSAGFKQTSWTFRDPTHAAELAARLSGKVPGIYFTLNPLEAGFPDKKAAKDVHVARRRNLLIDCDPERPADTSSTDAEKAGAWELAVRIRDFLSGLGWPGPVVADSGNGFHLLYSIDLPNDDDSKALVAAVLKALAARFDTPAAKVDTSVFNASRITKFYGTMACKGQDSSDRPHRCSRVIEIPDRRSPVDVGLLRAATAEEGRPVEGGLALDLGAEIERKRDQAEPADVPVTKAHQPPRTGVAEVWTPERRAVAYLDRCEPAISGKKGHNQAFKVACKVGPGFDLPKGIALRLIRDHYNPRCKPPWSEKELAHKVEDAYKVNKEPLGFLRDADRRNEGNGHRTSNGPVKAVPPPEVPPVERQEPDDDRPAIEITTRRDLVLAETVKALSADPDLYSRGRALVSVVAEEEDSARLTRKTRLNGVLGSPTIAPLSESIIGCRIAGIASFYTATTDKRGETVTTAAHPPDWLIRAVQTRKSWPGVRPLLGIAECPFPRPDGSIVSTPGYDPETGIFYRPAITFLPLPDRPTRDEARAAWKRLAKLVDQFPFDVDADAAVWGSALLTVVARPAIEGPVPGHVFVGNKAATGKGLLVNGVGIAATGRKLSTSPYPVDPVEAAKVALAIGRSGRQVVHFDNLDEGSTYGNSAIDSAMTTGIVEGRPVHSPDSSGDVPFSAALFASGNNIHPGRDAYRRWLPCNLVTKLERPEERTDLTIRDLPSHMLGRRAEIVRDILTILKAHALADYPVGTWAPLASFEEWDRVVRGALWFADAGDCCASRRKAADEAPERLKRLALLAGWAELPGATVGGVTTKKAVDLVATKPDLYDTLRNAFVQFGKDDKTATSGTIGNIIRAMKGNIIGEKRFVEAGDDHGVKLWKVETVAGTGGGAGGSGGWGLLSCRGGSPPDRYANNGDDVKPHEDVSESDPPDHSDPPPAEEGLERGVI